MLSDQVRNQPGFSCEIACEHCDTIILDTEGFLPADALYRIMTTHFLECEGK